jgi:hypothetical protein
MAAAIQSMDFVLRRSFPVRDGGVVPDADGVGADFDE